MSDEAQAPAEGETTEATEAVAHEPRGWRDLWQVPALVGGLALMVLGVVIAFATKPDPDIASFVRRAESQVTAEKYAEAIETLNTNVYPYVEREALVGPPLQAYHLLLARSIYLGQQELGISREENWRNIVAEYRDAERAEARIEPTDSFFLGTALAELDQLDAAMTRADSLPEARRDLRDQLYERVVERELARGNPDYQRVLGWLGGMLADGELPQAVRVWAIGRQGEVLLRQGYAEEAVNTVLRAMPRLMGEKPEVLAELHALLGRAYLELGAVESARKNLRVAESSGSARNETNAWVQVLLGRIDERENRPEEARDRYDYAVRRLGLSEASAEALLALAEVEALLERDDASLSAYRQLIDRLDSSTPTGAVTPERITQSMLDRAGDRLGVESADAALRFADLAESIWGVEVSPAGVRLAIARANEALANALVPPRDDGSPVRLTEAGLAPATREAARPHLVRAGAYYQMHADRVVIEDNEAYGESLWRSADAFDRAGDEASAIAGFLSYADGFPDSPRRAQAVFRVAQANQSRGEYELAATLYQDLVEAREDRDGGKGVGRWADASYVPLAQTLLLDDNAENDGQAEDLLTRVVNGVIGTPEAVNYPVALLQLANLYYADSRYPQAIERLEEAVDRFPDAEQIDSIKYRLGDAHRMEARSIIDTLDGALPDGERRALEQARSDRLARAAELFSQVVDGLGARDERRLSELERLYLRNASFYEGDCAYDLGDFAGAIRAYDAARQRYPRDPASLVALVQIVNAHVAQGDMDRARTANERARRFYESLPPQVWDDPGLPMTRRDWERWLDSSSALYSLDSRG